MAKSKLPQSRLVIALLLGLGLTQTPAVLAAPTDPGTTSPAPGFAKFDADGDGRISLEEFQAQNKDERAFKEGDTNHDGYLTQDEFVKAISIDSRVAVADYVGDTWITTKVKTLLLKDSLLSGVKINVGTQDRMVQLSGWLKNTDQISRAVKIANQVEGVKGVYNDLHLKD